ncbi:inactive serine/threonine-protein kinase TEX14 isoform X4 [Myiozetetes cayanensis]|uniref:inactive serine/threonine-protein kinase TEX14 isoform X4 n=1 Tax=Myiozetetes cayanensis TaxID=478635 RepID=UPI002160ED80|nr:inactive serine/threonine-protein kinase TEX14 isoform X4 [Myiozetetes cayanensis]
MAHPVPLPFPCPVKLGSVKGDSLEAELHDYVREGNYVKVKKLLKKGVLVDAVNSMGQTCLFTAALLGLSKIVDVLLDYGSDANHRCFDGSTPVHAAAFSGNQWILSKLLDEGGDLRAHDKDGRTPQHWALSARKECSAQMLEFIQQCTLHMQAALWNFPSDLLRKVGSSKALVSSPSRFGGLVQGNVDSALGRLLKGEASVAKNIYSFGFGKFYLAGNGHLGYLASLPIIGEKDVVQADDEPAFSYHVGPFMIMTNLMWGGSRVTVKELGLQPPQHSWKLRLADLLLAEQEHSSKLRHPHLLQLMSVCLSSDLEKTRLVYERVHFGSLYSILHERRTEFPVLQTETILHVLLQIIDALRFLHSRGFIHRSLSSYAIQMVSSGEAKLCNLEYMIESKDSGEHSDLTRIPVPVQLYRWCSPEVVLERAVTVKADVYSLCAVLQEALTESPPWKGFEDSVIKQLIISGEQLEADARLPMLYYDVVKSGLEPKQRNRSMKLQDIQYILKNDLKDLVRSQGGQARRPTVFADVNICWASAFSCQRRTVEFQEKEGGKAGGSPAPRDPVFREENSALVVQGASTSVQPVAQDKSPDVASEVQTTPSESDVDESLCSFEINEIFASYPEIHQDFLEGGSGLDETLKDAKRQQKEEDKSPLGVLSVSSGASCGDAEDGDSLESGTEFTAEEEEEETEASDLAQGRGDAGRRGNSPSPNEQHISKCVLNIKIIQSMLQQAADSLCRTEENLDRLKAVGKQKKLLQKLRMSQLSKQSFQERHCNRSDDASQNTNPPFSGVKTFLPKAVGPPSSDYIPPPATCQAQGVLGEDDFQAVPRAARETQAVQNEKRKSKMENNQRDLGCSARRSLDGEVNLNHEYLLPRVSARCQKKLNLQCQRGADSHPAARSEEGRWSYSKPRSEFYSKKISEERRMMQSDWRRRRCQLPSQDEQAGSGIAIHQNSVLPQQAENLSRGHSRELHCSLSSPPDVSEEFFTPDYFLPPEGSSELETSDTEGKSEDGCEGLLQKLPKGAKSSVQTSGGKRLFCSPGTQKCGSNKLGGNQRSQMPVVSVDAAREAMLWEPQEECQEKDVSVADIQDLSSIPCEQNFQRDGECQTPRLSHAPTSVSTPLSSEEKIPLAFERYKHCHELASDFSLCGSQEASSTMFKTFTTAYEGERSLEIPGAASRLCQLELKEPDGLPPVVPSSRNTRQAPALSEASQPSIDELPPPAQELLDEIELLKQQDSITPDLKEVGLQDCRVQINVPTQIRMESRESEEEPERNERQNQSTWTKESFTSAEDTERAHSTLDDILERMLHAVPGDEEIQEQPRGHTLGAAGLQDPEDAGRKNGVEERGAGAGGRAPESCAGTSADKQLKDQTSHLKQQQLSSASPFRIIVLDESSLCD